jgi:peptidyl-tRNA hydrolase
MIQGDSPHRDELKNINCTNGQAYEFYIRKSNEFMARSGTNLAHVVSFFVLYDIFELFTTLGLVRGCPRLKSLGVLV